MLSLSFCRCFAGVVPAKRSPKLVVSSLITTSTPQQHHHPPLLLLVHVSSHQKKLSDDQTQPLIIFHLNPHLKSIQLPPSLLLLSPPTHFCHFFFVCHAPGGVSGSCQSPFALGSTSRRCVPLHPATVRLIQAQPVQSSKTGGGRLSYGEGREKRRRCRGLVVTRDERGRRRGCRYCHFDGNVPGGCD